MQATSLPTATMLLALAWIAPSVRAEDTRWEPHDGFRMENRLFLENARDPVSQSTTIFLPGAVYDYLNNPAEVFVFDRPQNRFFLLDPMRRCAANLSAQEVAAFTDQLRARLEKQGDAYLKFLANPRFERSSGDAPDVLNLSSPWLTYEVDATPAPDAKTAHAYREFSDWLAQVSPMLEPSSRPPFARMQLNCLLAQQSLLPRQVKLTTTTGRGLFAKRRTIRSEHQWVDRLSEADVDRVAQTRQFMEIFNPVSIQQFCRK